MKNTSTILLFILFTFFVNFNNSYGQQINPKILEIYGDKTQSLVIDEPQHLERLNDLLDNRIKIIESQISGEEKNVKLSQVALLNKYNPYLTRDIAFDPLNFNPLKYDFNFFPKSTAVYRVDNTNYIIVIQPQTLK
jgi:hypothetical protein